MSTADETNETEVPLYFFEIEDGDKTRHLVGFLHRILAETRGLKSEAMVGEFDPDESGGFDPATFRRNPEFIAVFVEYMNRKAQDNAELHEAARQRPGERLYLVDPRDTNTEGAPAESDVLGSYDVDDQGAIVADSFEYNDEHVWFCPHSGVSGVFHDMEFYAAIHPDYAGGPFQIFQHEPEGL